MTYLKNKQQVLTMPYEFTIEFPLGSFIDLIEETLAGDDSKENPDEERSSPKGKKPPKGNKNKIRFFAGIVVSLFLMFMFNYEKSSNSRQVSSSQSTTNDVLPRSNMLDMDEMLRYNEFQCSFVSSQFKGEFWKYAKLNNIDTPKDFIKDHETDLRRILWGKILEGRRIFSNVSGMAEMIRELDDYYNYNKFASDFDYFMKTHDAKTLEEFEVKMQEYMREKQNEIKRALKSAL